MKIPFGTLPITRKAETLIFNALRTGRLSSGDYVRQFERQFARLIGTQHAVAVSSGTDALTLALATLYDFQAKRGAEVIVPALSFVATANAVLHAGFTPVFVDINRKTLNIDPQKIEQAITDRTVAIMPVHLMGKPADMDTINEIAQRHQLYVIEDAAEAHGGKYKGRNLGTLGDMACYSLYVAHIISCIEGGIITTDREDLAELLRSLRSHGRACKCKTCLLNVSDNSCEKRFELGTDIRFVFERVGFSSKMNELEAAVGLGSLDLYDHILAKRRQNLLAMTERIRRFEPYLTTFHEEIHERIGPHALPVLVAEGAPFTRDQIVQFLFSRGIDTRNLFLSIPTQCPGFKFLWYSPGDFPQAEYVGNSGFHVGVHQDITPDQIDYFANSLQEFVCDK